MAREVSLRPRILVDTRDTRVQTRKVYQRNAVQAPRAVGHSASPFQLRSALLNSQFPIDIRAMISVHLYYPITALMSSEEE